MIVRKLEPKEHWKTRKLWEEIFSEDTKAFLDYYYSVKTKENEIFVVEEEDIVAMLQLNPYEMRINDRVYPTNYIVAVATDERYRKRGYMGQLLRKAMREMYDRKEPFTFLMPAAEAIYYPYDFRYIYSRKKGEVSGKKLSSGIQIHHVQKENCGKIADFANEMLNDYQVVANRTTTYYETLLSEQQSENGDVMAAYRDGELVGVFCYAREGHTEVRDIIFAREDDFLTALFELTGNEEEKVHCYSYGEKRQPIIMARILHLETLIQTLKFQDEVDVIFEMQDGIIEENNGIFHLQGDAEGVRAFKRCDANVIPQYTVEIGDLTTRIFQMCLPEVFLNEVV